MEKKKTVSGTDDKWYPITDDFMFVTVFRNPERCRRFLEVILNRKIQKVTFPEGQKTVRLMHNAKSIRLDIDVEEDGRMAVYDCEMQTTKNQNLPKRARYYQGQIDLNILNAGEDYTQLRYGYVIFVCPFDPFGKDEYIYRFKNWCQLSDGTWIYLNDQTEKIFVNAVGHKGKVSKEFKSLMKLIAENKAEDTFTKDIQERVVAINQNEDWRVERMTLEMTLRQAKAEGEARGQAKMLCGIIDHMRSQGKTMSEISESIGLTHTQITDLIGKTTAV